MYGFYGAIITIIAASTIGATLKFWSAEVDGTVPVPDVPPTPVVEQPPPSTAEVATAIVEMAADKGISPARRSLKIALITGIADATFTDPVHKHYWFSLLANESAFNGRAKSHAGAVGIGQLIPSFRQDFAAACGLGTVDIDDLQDDYTNATLSACFFRELLKRHGGNVPLALVSYNAGANSQSAKKAAAGGSPAHEPSAYVTRIWVTNEKAKGK